MATFTAEFRWPLPPTAASVERYAATMAKLAGCPCHYQVVPQRAPDGISAALAVPRVSDNNLLALRDGEGDLDFAPVPFVWVHALRAVQELGGAVVKAVPGINPQWRLRRWDELGWKDRARLALGLGPWVK